jgi:ribosome-associated heat shock protein Hsp15
MDEKIRIDKFLWAVRIYKTRTIAAEECQKGRVVINGTEVKPSHVVKEGEVIIVRKPPVVHTYRVIEVIKSRVSAPKVKEALEDLTPEDELAKRELARMAINFQRDRGTGRPTKKDRREIDRIRDWE